jgi:cyclic pyranopterin phosphate synthase
MDMGRSLEHVVMTVQGIYYSDPQPLPPDSMPRKTRTRLTHLNRRGEVHMVDVGAKAATRRRAVAGGDITMQAATLKHVLSATHRKGDVLAVARIAGIQAAKKTAELIPLCHPVALTHVEVQLAPDMRGRRIRCRASAETVGQTGAEMEALIAVQVALLTIYDMCKAVDRGMVIDGVGLIEKSGGRSGTWRRE